VRSPPALQTPVQMAFRKTALKRAFDAVCVGAAAIPKRQLFDRGAGVIAVCGNTANLWMLAWLEYGCLYLLICCNAPTQFST